MRVRALHVQASKKEVYTFQVFTQFVFPHLDTHTHTGTRRKISCLLSIFQASYMQDAMQLDQIIFK